MNTFVIPRLHFITSDVKSVSHIRQIIEACRGGAKLIQLRLKNASREELYGQAKEARRITADHRVMFIIDDDVDVAREVEADGVHLGKEDMAPEDARKYLGPEAIIGGTADCFERVQALHGMVDYIGLGPYRFTGTKKKLSPVLGIEGFREIMAKCGRNHIHVPVIAIGGIKLDDISAVMSAGVHGIAVSSAIAASDNIVETTEDFVSALNAYTKE